MTFSDNNFLQIGQDSKNNPNNQEFKMQLQKYLFDHGLDTQSFECLLKGQAPSRSFIPLKGQPYKGHVKGFKGKGLAEKIVVEADVGETLFFEASRENIYVFGHWMGKADLRYVFDVGDEVCFEIHPIFDKNEHQNQEVPQASLVWLGNDEDRPTYNGRETIPVMNAQLDEKLWAFVKTKQMDEKMFRALVSFTTIFAINYVRKFLFFCSRLKEDFHQKKKMHLIPKRLLLKLKLLTETKLKLTTKS